MLNLTEHRPGNHHAIRSAEPTHLVIDDQTYTTSIILGARFLDPDWPVQTLDDLNEDTVAPLLAPEPEVVLLGAGERPRMPSAKVQHLFLRQGVGLECMSLVAAARTFSVLMSENRRVLAGLILPADDLTPSTTNLDTP